MTHESRHSKLMKLLDEYRRLEDRPNTNWTRMKEVEAEIGALVTSEPSLVVPQDTN
jgi:hypothetical protein